MAHRSMPTPRSLSFVLGVNLILLALCLIPGPTRRLTGCLFRLFFHVQYGEFEAVGQPPGCTVTIVPYYALSSQGRARREALVTSNGDRFLLAMCQGRGTTAPPVAGLFAGHPFQQWAALEVARVAVTSDGKNRQSVEQVEGAMRFVEAARRDHPDNGALWLAEGLVLAELGNNEIAMEMFQEAACRPLWEYQKEICRRIYDLSVADGFMPIDAALFAESANSPIGGIEWLARRHLDQMLADAIHKDDPTRFVELMDLCSRLRQCAWRDVHRPNRLFDSPIDHAGRAALEKLKDWPGPADPFFEHCEKYELERPAFLRYAGDYVSPELLRRVDPSSDESRAYYRKFFGHQATADRDVLLNAHWADFLGNLSLVSMATWCSAFVLMLAFSRRCVFPVVSRRPLRIRLRRLAISFPLCVWLFHHALHHRLQPIGLRDQRNPEHLFLCESVILGSLLSLVILGVVAMCRHRRGQIKAILIVSAINFSVILLCGHYQAATADAIMARTCLTSPQEASQNSSE